MLKQGKGVNSEEACDKNAKKARNQRDAERLEVGESSFDGDTGLDAPTC